MPAFRERNRLNAAQPHETLQNRPLFLSGDNRPGRLHLCGRVQAALQVAGYTAATAGQYDRFLNDPSFIGNPANWPAGDPTGNNPYPWSGVGRGVDGRWGTMISPSYFLSASHFAPSGTLRFYYTNDPNGGFEDHTIVSSVVRIGGSDVWLGQLDAPVSSSVAIYPILSLSNNNKYGGLGIATFGLSDTNNGVEGTATTVRLGTNNIDVTSPFGNGHVVQQQTIAPSTGLVYAYDYNPTIPNPNNSSQNISQPNESFLNPGDSGGPSFFLYAGASPALVGIHWFASDGNPSFSGDTFVPGYISAIQAAMTGETLSTVSPILGDFNLNGAVTQDDLTAMLGALTDISSYQTLHGLSNGYLKDIGDFNHDNVVNNADVQGLLDLLAANGAGSGLSLVPEPASVVLLAIGGLAVLWAARRKSRLSTPIWHNTVSNLFCCRGDFSFSEGNSYEEALRLNAPESPFNA